MHKITSIFAALALTTSCSLQLDSQYGLRLEPRRITSPERTEGIDYEGAITHQPATSLPTDVQSQPTVQTGESTVEINSLDAEIVLTTDSKVAIETEPTTYDEASIVEVDIEGPSVQETVTITAKNSMPYGLKVALVVLALIAAFVLATIFFFVGLAWVLLYELYWLDEIFILWGFLLMAASVALAIVAKNIANRLLRRGL